MYLSGEARPEDQSGPGVGGGDQGMEAPNEMSLAQRRKRPKSEVRAELLELMRLPAYDIEEAHLRADELLIELINDPEIEAAWLDFDRWYA